MHKIGLTGGIASGKTTVSAMFAFHRIPVFNADDTVHQLYRHDSEIKQLLLDMCPQTVGEDGQIDRKKLAAVAFHDPRILKELEALIHPKVHLHEEEFTHEHQRMRRPLALYDIPLLFETNAQVRMHSSVLVSCPFFLQKQRALRRSGMSEEKFLSIVAKQMPLHEKRKYADFEIHTGLGKAFSFRQVCALVQQLRSSGASCAK